MKNAKKVKKSPIEVNNNEKTQHQARRSVMQSKHKELLRWSFNQMFDASKFRCLKNPLSTSDPLVNTIGLNGIDDKFDNDSYTHFEEFMDDIVAVVQSYSSSSSTDAKVKTAVNSLLEQCQRDVESIKACTDCFEYWMDDHDNYFTRVCSTPHLLVYAKMNGYPNWPAKLMSIDGNKANVAFFGDYLQNDVSLANCFLYSEMFHRKTPKSFQKYEEELNEATEELKHHIENVKNKIGSFHPANGKVALKDCDLKQKLMSMFPGAFKEKIPSDSPEEESLSGNAEENDSHNESMVQNAIDKESTSEQEHEKNEEQEEESRSEEESENVTNNKTTSSNDSRENWADVEENDETSSTEMQTNMTSNELTVANTFAKSASTAIEREEHVELVVEKDFRDDSSSTYSAESAVENDSVMSSSDEEIPSIKDKIQTRRKRQRNDADQPEKAAESVPRKQPRFNEVVETMLENGDRGQENIPSTTVLMDKLRRLNFLRAIVRKEQQEIRELEREIAMTRDKPTCATCKIALDGLFFCSEQCQDDYE